MTGHDDEFDDFLARRRKLFRAAESDPLEPPDEVDRLVLRQAREAIETRRGPREIRGISWGLPLALAATLLVAFTVVLHVGKPKRAVVAEVTVEHVAQRIDDLPATNNSAPPASQSTASIVARRDTADTAEPAMQAETTRAASAAAQPQQAAAKAAVTREWRRDAKTWLAEIQRLRTEGRDAEADAELAEYKHQHRAYAASPDR